MLHLLQVFSQIYNSTPPTSAASGIGVVLLMIILLVGLLPVLCSIKIFQKAGRKWWEALIPVYNIYIWLEIVGRPGWWLVFFFVPFVSIVVSIILSIDIAKSFGKGVTVGILTALFPYVMFPIFAFSKNYQYIGPVVQNNSQSPSPTTPTQPLSPLQ